MDKQTPLVDIEINGRTWQFPKGKRLIEACQEAGHYIPHFCYHPGLSIAGNCRMCVVEIEMGGRSKVDISCNAFVSEGMKVNTESKAVQKARMATLEFMLLSHPLDCPVCDCAGECKLQDYYYEYGSPSYSRFEEDKVHKPKKQRLGKSIVLDAERCVLCSRCVRFFEEIDGKPQLGIRERGSHSELHTLSEEGITSDYSGNVVDLCPVGALTDDDFRFQRRVWYLQAVPSICTGCSRGCNIELQYDVNHDYKSDEKRVQRIKPRYNPDVNQWWICDHGRYSYHEIDRNRETEVRVRFEEKMITRNWEQALSVTGDMIDRFLKKYHADQLGLLVSPHSANETLMAARLFFIDTLGISQVDYRLDGEPEGGGDQLLRTDEPYPNARTCRNLKLTARGNGGSMLDLIRDNKLKGLIVFRHDLPQLDRLLLDRLKMLVVIDTHQRDWELAADVILPVATWAEENGTFTNVDGKTQRYSAAFAPPDEVRTEFEIIQGLARAMGKKFSLSTPQSALNALARFHADYEQISGTTQTSTAQVLKEAAGVSHV